MVFPSGFNTNLDLETWRLWEVRNSELERLTRKLFRIGAPNSASPARSNQAVVP